MTIPFEKQFRGDTRVFGRTAVLMGGTSSEREISLKSGSAVLEALKSVGVDAFGIDVQRHPVEQLTSNKIDRVFIALHGPGGEDGKIQALLGLLNIPFSGSGHAASAVAMDKWKTKQIWRADGLPTPDSMLLTKTCDWSKALEFLGGEAFVKPIHEGSSIGMSCVNDTAGLQTAFNKAQEFDSAVMAEKRIRGAEYTVAVLNGKALAPIKLEPAAEFYDFDAKYISDETGYLCPCGLQDDQVEMLKKLALDAFNSIGCSGWGRVDLMSSERDGFQLLEVNTVPGMTDHSLVPMAAKEAGLSFSDLVLEILNQSL